MSESKTSKQESRNVVHAEMLFTGCGELGCKEKTREDLWFAEQQYKLLQEMKKRKA